MPGTARRCVWPPTAGAATPTSPSGSGLSVSAVHQRVRRLEKRGVIRGYAAQIDASRSGCR